MRQIKYISIIFGSIILLSLCTDRTKKSESLENISKADYLTTGHMVAMETFATLSSNLQSAMKQGGVSNAVEYCNVAAVPLVDSLQQLHQVNIKRTSLKVRNPNNKPTDMEKEQLLMYQKQLSDGMELEPVLHESTEGVIYNAPIYVMPFCQRCHGSVGTDITNRDYEHIMNLYPLDQATDYQSGDLRGMWSITFYNPQTKQQ